MTIVVRPSVMASVRSRTLVPRRMRGGRPSGNFRERVHADDDGRLGRLTRGDLDLRAGRGETRVPGADAIFSRGDSGEDELLRAAAALGPGRGRDVHAGDGLTS